MDTKEIIEELNKSIDFEWGTEDCSSWSIGIFDRLHNTNISKYIPSYKNKFGALRLLCKIPLEERLSSHLKNIHPKKALPGDLAQLNNYTLGIVIGSTVAFIGDNNTIVHKPLLHCKNCWRI